MIIFGHKTVDTQPFFTIKNSKDIESTPPNSVVVFDYEKSNLELCKYCRDNRVSFALKIDDLKDVLFANALKASYIICNKELSSKAQKFANEYMFDAKILLYSEDEVDLVWAADLGIDGIIFKEGIK